MVEGNQRPLSMRGGVANRDVVLSMLTKETSRPEARPPTGVELGRGSGRPDAEPGHPASQSCSGE
jgi:hypothetical protein